MVMPVCDFTTPNQILAGGWPWRIGVVWSNSGNCWTPMDGDAVTATAANTGANTTALGLNLAQLQAINANTDTIEPKLDTLHTDLTSLIATQMPSVGSYSSAALVLIQTVTFSATPNSVIAVSTTGNIGVQDNGTLKSYFSAGFWVLPRPIICATSVKVSSLISSNVTLWLTT